MLLLQLASRIKQPKAAAAAQSGGPKRTWAGRARILTPHRNKGAAVPRRTATGFGTISKSAGSNPVSRAEPHTALLVLQK